MIDIKTNIVKVLQDQGKTQIDLCKALRITPQSLQYYFKANLTLANLERIAGALNVEPWQLLKPLEEGETIPQRQPRPTAATVANCPHCGRPLKISIQ